MSDENTATPFELDDTQVEAVTRCLNMQKRIVPISGEAGTGKTTMMKHVYDKLTEAGYDVVMCAPTGKAAKRITEATGVEAFTIHRLLEYPYPGERDPKTGQALVGTDPKRRIGSPIDYSIVLADEYAMVNHEVHRNLLNALPRGGCLRVFGDVAQLPPIEQNERVAAKPTPFMEILEKFDGFYLTTLHRQDEGSDIAQSARLIKDGRMPRRLEHFVFQITQRPTDALADYVMGMLMDRDIRFDIINNQVIVPGRQGWTGTWKLNNLLQNIYHPEVGTAGIKVPRHKWHEKQPIRVVIGDKVIWTENSYDLRSFPNRYETYDRETETYSDWFPPTPRDTILNGESGVLTEIDDDGGFVLDVGDREVYIPSQYLEYSQRSKRLVNVDPRTRLDLGYAVTTHKAQGSEYEYVVYVLNKSASYNMNRKNFYTAASRARLHFHLISDSQSLQLSVNRAESYRKKK